MQEPLRRVRWPGGAALTALTALATLTGCPSNPTPNPNEDMGGDSPDMATVSAAVPTVATKSAEIAHPTAAVADPDGNTIYVAAYDDSGQAQIFSGSINGSSFRALTETSGALGHPVGLAISGDGKTLVVADPGRADGGGLYQVTLGGSVSALTTAVAPAGVTFSPDGKEVYYTGTARDTGAVGVWKVALSGGTPSQVASGDPLASPSGLAFTNDGKELYVADAAALGPRTGALLRIENGKAVVVTKAGLPIGFPAGVSPTGPGNGDVLVLSSQSATGAGDGTLWRVTPGGDFSKVTINGPALTDPTTIHRAEKKSVWVVIDSVIPGNPDQPVGAVLRYTP